MLLKFLMRATIKVSHLSEKLNSFLLSSMKILSKCLKHILMLLSDILMVLTQKDQQSYWNSLKKEICINIYQLQKVLNRNFAELFLKSS